MQAEKEQRGKLREDDATLTFETSQEVEVFPSFEAMNLKDKLLRGIFAYG